MRRVLQPFNLTLFALLASGYAYVAARLAAGGPLGAWLWVALALPFVMVWIVPLLYWSGGRDRHGPIDEFIHRASYLCMGWVSFVLVLTIARDLVLLATVALGLARWHALAVTYGPPLVLAGSVLVLAFGVTFALRAPRVRQVDLPIDGLAPGLEGLRIAQISDLHVGLTIRRPYVERVVELALALKPDVVALTGDLVDGPVAKLAADVAPLARLASGGRAFFIVGNHDCYSGMHAWCEHFRQLGYGVLQNEHALVRHKGATLLVGGVLDPAAAMAGRGLAPRPDVAMGEAGTLADLRLLLAHNPKIAPAGAAAGFDVQLSGHTHAGQFFPWTIAVRLIHAPHVAGLSREGRMWVYVSAGTGTWGPPVRLGTRPELTLIRLTRA